MTLSMNNILTIQDKKWFLEYKTNTLMYMDQNYERAYAKCYLSKDRFDFYPKVYGKTEYVDGRIIVVPEAPIPIALYDLESQMVSYIKYKIDFDGFPGKIFSGVIKKDNYVFFIPCCYDSFVRMDMSNYELHYYSLSKYIHNNQPFFSWDGYIGMGDEIWFASYANNTILALDCDKGNVREVLSIPDEKGIMGIVTNSEGNILIIPMSTKRIYIYDKACNKIQVISDFGSDYIPGMFSFSQIIKRGDKIVLLPRDANSVLLLDNDRVKKVLPVDRKGKSDYFSRYYPISNAEWEHGKWYFFTEQDGVVCYDENIETANSQCVYIDTTSAERDESLIVEDEMWGLNWLVGHI